LKNPAISAIKTVSSISNISNSSNNALKIIWDPSTTGGGISLT
jgi:hypothetical protein